MFADNRRRGRKPSQRMDIIYDADTVEIFHGLRLVTVHHRDDTPYGYSQKESHNLPGRHGSYEKDLEEIYWRAGSIDNILLVFLKDVAAQKKYLPQAFRTCRGIMSLEKKYGLKRLVAACACAAEGRLYSYNDVKGILERGDDITITGAKHKSTETYRRELADECRTLSNEVGMKKTLLYGLNRSITKAETKIKALQTMVSNLEKAEAEKQATIAELEDYMKNHLGDAVEIKAKITATRKELWDVRDKLNDKKMKLAQAKLQLDELQKNTSHIEARNREIKADFEKTAISYQQQIINKIWAQAGIKALAEIADIYPRMTSIHDSSLFDDSFAMDFINYGDKIIYCAMYLYIGYVNEATNFAESQGGGGSDTKDWGREKDEDEIEWIRRCLRQATRMVKPKCGRKIKR